MIQKNQKGSKWSSGDAGFTLIEGIIATGIISTALIVGLSLAYSNLTAAQANSDRIIAANLAREGLEVMRNVRDSNWIRRALNIDKNDSLPDLQFYVWDDFLDYSNEPPVGIKGYADIYLNPDFNEISTDFRTQYALRSAPPSGGSYDLLPCVTAGTVSCRIQKKNNVYFQNTTAINGATFTPFYRRISIKPVCLNASKEYVDEFDDPTNPIDNCTGSGEEKIANLIISTVMWKRGNKILDVTVKEKLYNWRNL